VGKDIEKKLRVLFLTLSTPWGGHQAAQIGVEHAPAVIPSWIDMIPNSPFQKSLFQTPLSDQIDYYLFLALKAGTTHSRMEMMTEGFIDESITSGGSGCGHQDYWIQ